MELKYISGIILAVLAGISTYLGQVLQKIAVNNIPENFSEKKYKYLLKNKIWLLGLTLYIVLATIFYMLAELFIGPILIPGLMNLGLIVLIIASVKLAKEKIRTTQIIAIIILSFGTFIIALSNLSVDYKKISLENTNLILRIICFSVATVLLWLLFNLIVKKSHKSKGIYKAIAAGFPYVLTNFWIFPLYITMPYVFSGNFSPVVILFFISSCLILVIVNILGIKELQIAYQYEKVSLVAPVQQIPIQIAPIVYYYIFYSSFSDKSVFILITGIILFLISGFLLTNNNYLSDEAK